MRLDIYLVQSKLAPSRTQAQDFIAGGFVYSEVNGSKKPLSKANYQVSEGEKIVVVANNLQKFVSRAGLKLEGALNKLALNVEGWIALDVGQSTGGFTDCLLSKGASKVIGVDVGRDQLHPKIKTDPRVTSFENLHVKDIVSNPLFVKSLPDQPIQLVVMDISFISITKAIPTISKFMAKDSHYLFLVKPQFECGPDNLDDNGIVKSDYTYELVEKNIKDNCMNFMGDVQSYFESPLLGKDGNREFFIYGKKVT